MRGRSSAARSERQPPTIRQEQIMQIGLIGLGRMGSGIAERLLQGNHAVVGFDMSHAHVEEIVQKGATGARSLERFDSRVPKRFAHQVIAALRNQFGGHAVRREE
jgi:6-phosphogluconate dehydrogenase (decarboxylating)